MITFTKRFEDTSLEEISEIESLLEAKLPNDFKSILLIYNGGYLAIGYQKDNLGEIYVYFSSEGPYKVASSFTEFLESLKITDTDF
ncbi:SMI1/KNR4 family protein [Tenacibaculum aiptasiae]|uniref:SMI1/KNR4 family protein n=1 Tax=Tenacibaculum aiptasiae TaxID=426481 RepID=A0A7J5AN80_9FLAO|nr:SMI1/KNR4 family protein [Tenacibaculum aiptasiae]KAB1158917.1 SMI1/KNR4 family protein [Tenacibaculum aiptasiae]